MQVGSSHPIRITASVNDPVILTNHGSTVYYGDYPEVSSSSNTGSIADAATQTITSAQYVISANQSDVTTAPVSSESAAVVNTVFGRVGAVVATTGDYTVAKVTGAAPAASPTFTGTVTLPSVVSTTSTLGFYATTPAARPSAYTLTYATKARTLAADTSSAVATTGSTNVTPYGYASAAQADAVVTAINAIKADLIVTKNVLAQAVADLQTLGLLQ